jgi:activator of 2-hydroxyglutaryl-CoA dehydratase
MRIEDFGEQALQSKNPVHIAGRCTLIAESDMIHKQQMGYKTKDIVYGLCQVLVRNYLNNVGLGKEMQPLIVGYRTSSFECKACPTLCDIAQVFSDGKVMAGRGGRCDLGERINCG